jgi:hypothetical protein
LFWCFLLVVSLVKQKVRPADLPVLPLPSGSYSPSHQARTPFTMQSGQPETFPNFHFLTNSEILNYCGFSLCVCVCVCGTVDWTQGIVCALYCLSHTPIPFFWSYFLNRVSCLCPAVLDINPICTSLEAGKTGLTTKLSFITWGGEGSRDHFSPGLALNCDPPYLCLLMLKFWILIQSPFNIHGRLV